MNMTPQKWIGVAIVVVSVLTISTTQLTTLFGQGMADKIVAAAIMLNGMLGGIVALINPSQDATVKSVLALPGVQKIDVNEKANPSLAKMAMDPTVNKIGPTPEAAATVAATAKETTS